MLSGSVSLTPTGYPEEAELRAFAAEALAAVALLACLIPARRATRIDPVTALAEQ